MRSKKLIWSVVVIVAAIVLSAVITVVRKTIELYYASQVAPDQVNDYTNAYQVLKTQEAVFKIINVGQILIILIAIILLFKIWYKASKKTN